jgi:hypothetical protein
MTFDPALIALTCQPRLTIPDPDPIGRNPLSMPLLPAPRAFPKGLRVRFTFGLRYATIGLDV